MVKLKGTTMFLYFNEGVGMFTSVCLIKPRAKIKEWCHGFSIVNNMHEMWLWIALPRQKGFYTILIVWKC